MYPENRVVLGRPEFEMPEDYPRAAGKLLDDAGVLQAQSRFDGAAYLAGYVVECVLKTLIEAERAGVRRIHDLGKLGAEALRLAGLPTQRTAKYVTIPGVTVLQYGPPPGKWRETLRYEAPGMIPPATAAIWFAEASRLYGEVIVRMRLDGMLP